MKRFCITLGLSILIWLISGLFQALLNKGEFGAYLFGTGCELTGYPLAMCISSNQTIKILVTYFINISFWFLVLHFSWKWFNKSRGQK